MGVFKLLPLVSAASGSFHVYDPVGTTKGITASGNYSAIVANPEFGLGLLLNIGAGLAKVPLQLVAGLICALLFRRQSASNTVARAFVIAPLLLGLPVTTLLFSYLFDINVGLVNTILTAIGLEPVQWLAQPAPAQTVVLLLSIWADTGTTMLVFLSGLSAIPRDVIAAAELDGATSIDVLRTITIPLLGRSIEFAIVMATLSTFQLVVPIIILTSGGPNNATDLASFQIYRAAFTFFDFGRASAMSLLLITVLLIVVSLEIGWLRVDWHYDR
jgi:ABC-type sugar transport system permease subunit